MEWKEIAGKTVDEALNNAMLELGTTIEHLEHEVIEKESSKLFGLMSKPAKIRVRLIKTPDHVAQKFLQDVFATMGMKATIQITYDVENSNMDIDVAGDDMGVLIGKRGQTLDSLQYLLSLVINKDSENYIKVKLDTENYRARRKETLENLAKNIAQKVKRTRKSVSLEPMNPYERRIIHSALQNDKYIETYSEGEEPYRKVVINIKKAMRDVRYNSKYGKDNNKVNKYQGSNKGVYNKQNSHSGQGNQTNQSNQSNQTNQSKSYNKNYSTDYKKDYEKYKESKEKKAALENA